MNSNTSERRPRLSVIVCTYNRAEFLPKSIGSIRECGLDPQDYEIVVVDDGSTDNTAAVLDKLAGPDLRIIRQVNMGLSSARNTGIAAAHGEYIAYLDSDDYWLPGPAKRMIEFLNTNKDVDVVFAEARVGNDNQGYIKWTDWAGRAEFANLPFREANGIRIYDERFYHLLIKRNLVFTGAVFQRRTALDAVVRPGREYFSPSLNGAGDYELYLRLAINHTFAYCPDTLAVYFQHPSQMTTALDKMAREFCETRRLHLNLIPKSDSLAKKLTTDALRNELFYYAYIAYDRKDYAEANRRFYQRVRHFNWEPKSIIYWLFTCLPSSLVRIVRGLLQRVRKTNDQPVGPQPWAPAVREKWLSNCK